MKLQKRSHRYCVFSIAAVLALAMLFGCQHQKPAQKKENAFFEKWRVTAEKSKGYSPAPTQRALELGEADEALKPKQTKPPGADLPDQPITLKMQNVDVAVLLRALARAAGQNIVINESVGGKVNIDVASSPWNQAFLSILNAQGLAYEKDGNIIRIITLEDRSRNLEQLETEQKIKTKTQEIARVDPLITRVVKINYADAGKLKTNLEGFLTEKQEGEKIGVVMVDEHTNSLIIQAMREDLAEMIPLINELDRPTPQVLIEAHIVETDQDTARTLGVRWGWLYQNAPDYLVASGFGSNITGATPGGTPSFPGIDITGDLGMTLGLVAQDVGNSLIALQLSALQNEGQLNILSSPSVTTLDNQAAIIESGREVPYQTVEDNDVKIEFKKAVLKLEVTPHVIEGKTLKLNINVNKDEVEETAQQTTSTTPPSILTKRASTNIILFDGQTTVIGGLSKENLNEQESGPPGLKDIPLLGWLFKNTRNTKRMEELLIFITPHILKQRPLEIGQTESQNGAEEKKQRGHE